MTCEDISDLIAQGEGVTVEFRRSLSRDLGRELCAFANANGGAVLIGVSDAGEIIGVSDHNRLKSRVQSIARSGDPAITVEVESVGEVLLVVVPPQKRKPYSFGGRFFLREDASSQQMSNAEVEDLFYAVGRLHFDRTPCVDFSLDDDLDEETYQLHNISIRGRVRSMKHEVSGSSAACGLSSLAVRLSHAREWSRISVKSYRVVCGANVTEEETWSPMLVQ